VSGQDRVERYYAQRANAEWLRLLNPGDGAIEFAITTRMMSAHIEAASRVLDIGGGPGRYTIFLAEQGHRVVLADLSPELLDEARGHIADAGIAGQVEAMVTADACNLSRWGNSSFDAVACLGPFYHLPEAERREACASELARVLRPGGVLFAAFIPRLVFLRRSMIVPAERPNLRDPEFVRRVVEDGGFLNNAPGRFDAAYGARPEELEPFFSLHNFDCVALIAAEGISPPASRELTEMAETDPIGYAAAIDVIAATAHEPSILGAANHLLYVGRKRD
jgi:S-adenosylmethionine-dependent methyltransferase